MSEKFDLKAVMNQAQVEGKLTGTGELVGGTTSGIVITNKPEKSEEEQGVKVSQLNKDIMESVDAYLAEMDEDIEEVKEDVERLQKNKSEDDKNIELADETSDPNIFKEKYQEAIVVIDKTNMGSVVNFTDEEREKLEKVKKIKLEEVETVALQTLVRKKVKKGNVNKILKKNNTIRITNIVLPISGFTVSLMGCSTYELMTLITENENTTVSYINKWRLIHSKIENTSIGKMDFNTFLNSVAQLEYDVFVYGLLCATYPEEDIFPLVCPKCKKSFEHKYTVRTLLRAEDMADVLKEKVVEIVDASHVEETAKECYSNSILNKTETFKLPETEYVVEINVQTAHTFIYDSIGKIESMDKKYEQATILASAIGTMLVPDVEEGGYFEIEDAEDIIELIYTLPSTDLSIIGLKVSKMVEDLLFKFGLMDITCSNEKCKHHTNTLDVDMDSILFQKYQQATNITIE